MTLALWQTIWGGSDALAGYASELGIPREVWDFSGDFYSSGWAVNRASEAVTTTMAGVLQPVAADVARVLGAGASRGLLLETASSNGSNMPSAPGWLAGVYKGGDAAATLTLVDDTPGLAASGLQDVTGGKAYLLDNSAGSGGASLFVQGAVDSSASWCFSAFVRTSAAFKLRMGYGDYPTIGSEPGDPVLSSNVYARVFRKASQLLAGGYNTQDVMRCDVEPGGAAWIVLTQWEDGLVAPTSVIETDGVSGARAAESLTLAMVDGTYDVVVDFTDGSSTTALGESVSGGSYSVAAANKRVASVRAF